MSSRVPDRGGGGARENEKERKREGVEAVGARRTARRPRCGARSKDDGGKDEIDGAAAEKTTGRRRLR